MRGPIGRGTRGLPFARRWPRRAAYARWRVFGAAPAPARDDGLPERKTQRWPRCAGQRVERTLLPIGQRHRVLIFRSSYARLRRASAHGVCGLCSRHTPCAEPDRLASVRNVHRGNSKDALRKIAAPGPLQYTRARRNRPLWPSRAHFFVALTPAYGGRPHTECAGYGGILGWQESLFQHRYHLSSATLKSSKTPVHDDHFRRINIRLKISDVFYLREVGAAPDDTGSRHRLWMSKWPGFPWQSKNRHCRGR